MMSLICVHLVQFVSVDSVISFKVTDKENTFSENDVYCIVVPLLN
jgi:hypothetical protein